MDHLDQLIQIGNNKRDNYDPCKRRNKKKNYTINIT